MYAMHFSWPNKRTAGPVRLTDSDSNALVTMRVLVTCWGLKHLRPPDYTTPNAPLPGSW